MRKHTASDFWRRVEWQGDCLVWIGPLDGNGYGAARWEGRFALAHRLAFFLMEGYWPGYLLHSCDYPPCVIHTREGTHAENMADMTAKGRARWGHGHETHCPANHPYDEDNTHYDRKGHRRCRLCNRDRMRRLAQRSDAGTCRTSGRR